MIRNDESQFDLNMDIPDLERMAFHYNKDVDFKKIEFEWNGEFGFKCGDANYKFRMELCEFIYPQIHKAKIELIRDVYIEFGKFSEASFCAYTKMYLLGQELLTRGGTEYVMDYLKGASYTVDTYATTSGISISKELAKEILTYIEGKLKVTTDKSERTMLEHIGITRFGWLARDSRTHR